MVLIHLIYKKIEKYFKTQEFPNQNIFVSKQDILDIQKISLECYEVTEVNLTSTYLSKLETLGNLLISYLH